MDKRMMNIVWGIVVTLLGVILLLITSDVIFTDVDASWLFGIAFFFSFIIFMGLYISMHRKQFWPLIPGITSLGLCILILGEKINVSPDLGAGLFMGFIGLSFLAIYLFHPMHWWSIIPAGMIGSVAFVIIFGNTLGVGLMFLGMGATFIALYFILKNKPDEHWWPLIPGGILAFMGMLFLFFDDAEFANFVLPVSLIIVGAILLFQQLRKKKNSDKA
ncbi:MAG: hypothetical protein ACOY90_15535 [Candidatus Zhuqueibacterota bacterium]